MGIYWMVAFLVLVFIELITVNLVTVWFAVGALVGFILTYFTDNVIIQMIGFIVVSLVSLLLTRKIVSKLRVSNIEATNLDRVIGQIGVVSEKITEVEIGEVKVDGKRWSAVSTENISVGSKVKILSIDGVKLKVEKIKEEN